MKLQGKWETLSILTMLSIHMNKASSFCNLFKNRGVLYLMILFYLWNKHITWVKLNKNENISFIHWT